MHIGILQTGHAPDEIRASQGDYDAMFARLLGGHDFTFTTWNVVDMDFPASVHDAEGWLITGSRHGVYDDLPFIAPLEALIREAFEARVPIVGICFGHQIVAQALGGRVEKFGGGWAVGRRVYDWQGREVALHAWHQDQVIEPPEGAEVLAGNDFTRYAALRYGDRALTVQPHPEFGAEVIDGLIRHRGAAVPPERLEAARASLSAPVADRAVARQLAEFLKAPRHG